MKRAGGIIALVAGVFAVFAAGLTILSGGIAVAAEAEGADTVVNLGWAGLACAFGTIILGAIATSADTRKPGIVLMLLAVVGAIGGGTLVAIFMALAFIGGALASINGRHASSRTQAQPASIRAGRDYDDLIR